MRDDIWRGRDFLLLDASLGQVLKSRGVIILARRELFFVC